MIKVSPSIFNFFIRDAICISRFYDFYWKPLLKISNRKNIRKWSDEKLFFIFEAFKKRRSVLNRKIAELLQHAEGELQQGVERRHGEGGPVVDVRHRPRRGVAEQSLHSEAGLEPGDV